VAYDPARVAWSVTVSGVPPGALTVEDKPRWRRQFKSRRTQAAISEKVAAIVRSSGWGAGEWCGAKNIYWAPGREGGPILTGGATLLATCWGEGFSGFWALLPESEQEAA